MPSLRKVLRFCAVTRSHRNNASFDKRDYLPDGAPDPALIPLGLSRTSRAPGTSALSLVSRTRSSSATTWTTLAFRYQGEVWDLMAVLLSACSRVCNEGRHHDPQTPRDTDLQARFDLVRIVLESHVLRPRTCPQAQQAHFVKDRSNPFGYGPQFFCLSRR